MQQEQSESLNERELLLEHMKKCEKMLGDCPIDQFTNLRLQLKQTKEKLRLLNQLSRMHD